MIRVKVHGSQLKGPGFEVHYQQRGELGQVESTPNQRCSCSVLVTANIDCLILKLVIFIMGTAILSNKVLKYQKDIFF